MSPRKQLNLARLVTTKQLTYNATFGRRLAWSRTRILSRVFHAIKPFRESHHRTFNRRGRPSGICFNFLDLFAQITNPVGDWLEYV